MFPVQQAVWQEVVWEVLVGRNKEGRWPANRRRGSARVDEGASWESAGLGSHLPAEGSQTEGGQPHGHE